VWIFENELIAAAQVSEELVESALVHINKVKMVVQKAEAPANAYAPGLLMPRSLGGWGQRDLVTAI
jgi:hypothetical protein